MNNKRRYNQTSIDKEKRIIESYNKGNTSTKVAQDENTNPSTVLQILRRNGYKTRTYSEAQQIYTYNKNFFEKIDTEEKAYWLGFIYADGNVSRGKDLCIGLSAKDKVHLEKFIKSIEGDNKYYLIKTRFSKNHKETLCAYLRIRCQKMVEDLNKVGIMAKKSMICSPPSLNENLEKHFWRGVVDGDGCIYKSYKKTKLKNGKVYGYEYYGLSLVGNKKTIMGFVKYLKETIDIDINCNKHKMIFSASSSGKKAIKIADLLFDDCNIYLDRKKQKYEDMKEFYKDKIWI